MWIFVYLNRTSFLQDFNLEVGINIIENTCLINQGFYLFWLAFNILLYCQLLGVTNRATYRINKFSYNVPEFNNKTGLAWNEFMSVGEPQPTTGC